MCPVGPVLHQQTLSLDYLLLLSCLLQPGPDMDWPALGLLLVSTGHWRCLSARLSLTLACVAGLREAICPDWSVACDVTSPMYCTLLSALL